MILSRAELDRNGCSEPNCTHEHDEELFLQDTVGARQEPATGRHDRQEPAIGRQEPGAGSVALAALPSRPSRAAAGAAAATRAVFFRNSRRPDM